MANDTTKPPEPKSEAEKKHNSLLEQVTTLLKSPDLQKGIKDVSSLITGKGPTEAQQILDDLKAKDAERLKKIEELQGKIKANEAKIAANNELLQQSRDAVTKLEAATAEVDARIAESKSELEKLKAKDKDLQTEEAAAAQKLKDLMKPPAS